MRGAVLWGRPLCWGWAPRPPQRAEVQGTLLQTRGPPELLQGLLVLQHPEAGPTDPGTTQMRGGKYLQMMHLI